MGKIEEKTIKANSIKLYALFDNDEHYTFNRLHILSQFDSTDLCLALIQLVRENRIEQRNEGGIYYIKIAPERKQ